MKILCILSSSSLSGGSSVSFLSYIKELKKKDIEIAVTCPNKGPVYTKLKESEIETYVIPVRWNIYPHKISWKSKLIFPFKLAYHYLINKLQEKRLYKLCNTISPHIIYTNVGVVNIGYNVAKRLNIPHVYHIREFQDLDFDMKIIPSKSKFLASLKDCYTICITRCVQQHYKLQNCDKSIVVYDGIRDGINFLPQRRKNKTFLFVGRLDKKKGILDVLAAFKQFTQQCKEYKLHICGEASSKETMQHIKDYCTINYLNENVEFLGVRQDIDLYMQQSHALIMASHFEGLGRVTAEAMFNNCLVIGRDNAGTKEQFDNGLELTSKEIALRWNTQEELTQKMLYATRMPESEYNEFCSRAFHVVNKLYTNEECANTIYNFLKSIIVNKKKYTKNV